MGKKLESSLVTKNNCSPSPDTYQPNTTLSKLKSPQFKIGSEPRGSSYDIRKAKSIPGAGTYELPSMCFNTTKPRFFMGQKIAFDDTTKYIQSLPGPGTHDAKYQTLKMKSPIYSMGKRIMDPKNSTSIVPGPGTYINRSEKLKQSAPSFGFGTSKRPQLGSSRDNVPGPGSYKLPSKIQDVPAYALPSRKEESKYV